MAHCPVSFIFLNFHSIGALNFMMRCDNCHLEFEAGGSCPRCSSKRVRYYRDPKKEADVRAIEFANGILSPQTWSQRAGLDYEQEQANIRAWKEQK